MNKLILVSLVTVMFGLMACKNKQNDSAQPDLSGTWRSESLNGIDLTTNTRTVVTFLSSTKKQMSQASYVKEYGGFTWLNKVMGEYKWDGTNLTFSGESSSSAYYGTATAIDAQSMRVHFTSYSPATGVPVTLDDNLIYRRLPDNLKYEELIVGLWQGVAATGQQTYGSADHRWEYKSSNNESLSTYVYYTRDSLTNQWVAAKQELSEYNVHGNWLATRWSKDDDPTTYYEWWDIDEITSDTMRWSASRLDTVSGNSYRATFTLVRVK